MKNHEEALDLLNLARDDYKSLQALVEMDLVTHVVFFLAQQTVEKSMKAVLALNSVVYPKIHDLVRIAVMLKDNGVEVPIDENSLKILNPFAADCRYGLPEVEFPDARKVFQIAKSTIEWCELIAKEV